MIYAIDFREPESGRDGFIGYFDDYDRAKEFLCSSDFYRWVNIHPDIECYDASKPWDGVFFDKDREIYARIVSIGKFKCFDEYGEVVTG